MPVGAHLCNPPSTSQEDGQSTWSFVQKDNDASLPASKLHESLEAASMPSLPTTTFTVDLHSHSQFCLFGAIMVWYGIVCTHDRETSGEQLHRSWLDHDKQETGKA
jgi:hypothetical protein